jgi:hypothetical protein
MLASYWPPGWEVLISTGHALCRVRMKRREVRKNGNVIIPIISFLEYRRTRYSEVLRYNVDCLCSRVLSRIPIRCFVCVYTHSKIVNEILYNTN